VALKQEDSVMADSLSHLSGGIDEKAGIITQVHEDAQKVSELAEHNQAAISGINSVVDEFEV
jgi:hypothetical protein